ncbi:MAG: ferritin-like domain-containing protein [Elusimicrobia bacterium]|nr:ferritin-like domain-containing protein [Elusimicrobiota bacterium]
METPHLPAGHPFHAVLDAAVARRAAEPPAAPPPPCELWGAEFFGLEKTRAFASASQEDRRKILGFCAEGILEEGYFIEKSGLNCNAALMLAAETVEEKTLYALMAADEAVHLRLVSPYLPDAQSRAPQNPFLSLLSRVIVEGTMPAKVYLLQVLLEGWGLTHYRTLAEGCRAPALATAFRRILKDEALHHRGGVLLFDPQRLSDGDRAFVAGAVVEIFRMVQAGPQLAARAVERTLGATRAQRAVLFAELETERHSGDRLRLLRGLLAEVDSRFVEDVFERYDLLRPFTPEECAA